MPEYTRVEVDPNDNSLVPANLVFHNNSPPFIVAMVRIYDGEPGGRLCHVTGWSSSDGGSPVSAYGVHVEDSGAGGAYVVYGGDWGIRLAPADSETPWSMDDPDQWGETHLVLADAEDLLPPAPHKL
jgi:hypothetical protein